MSDPNFSLVLNRQPAEYYSGEEIQGTVHLSTKYRYRCNSIALNVFGKEKFEDKTSEDHDYFVQKCLDIGLCFLQSRPGSYANLEVGNYSYPFKVRLPENLPSSYACDQKASIVYSIKAKLDIPWRSDIVATKYISITNQFN